MNLKTVWADMTNIPVDSSCSAWYEMLWEMTTDPHFKQCVDDFVGEKGMTMWDACETAMAIKKNFAKPEEWKPHGECLF